LGGGAFEFAALAASGLDLVGLGLAFGWGWGILGLVLAGAGSAFAGAGRGGGAGCFRGVGLGGLVAGVVVVDDGVGLGAGHLGLTLVGLLEAVGVGGAAAEGGA